MFYHLTCIYICTISALSALSLTRCSLHLTQWLMYIGGNTPFLDCIFPTTCQLNYTYQLGNKQCNVWCAYMAGQFKCRRMLLKQNLIKSKLWDWYLQVVQRSLYNCPIMHLSWHTALEISCGFDCHITTLTNLTLKRF